MYTLFLLLFSLIAACTICHVSLRILSIFAITALLVRKIKFNPPTL